MTSAGYLLLAMAQERLEAEKFFCRMPIVRGSLKLSSEREPSCREWEVYKIVNW